MFSYRTVPSRRHPRAGEGTKTRKTFRVASPHRAGVGMLGIKSWTSFPRGQSERRKRAAGEGGAGEKTGERKRETESAGRRGNERILFFFVSVISLLSPI